MFDGWRQHRLKSNTSRSMRSDGNSSETTELSSDYDEKVLTKAELRRLVAQEERKLTSVTGKVRHTPIDYEAKKRPLKARLLRFLNIDRKSKAELRRQVQKGEKAMYGNSGTRKLTIGSEVYVIAGVIVLGVLIVIFGNLLHIIHLQR